MESFPQKSTVQNFGFFYSARFGKKFIKPVPVVQFSIFQRILGGNYLHYSRKFQPGLNTRTLGAPEALGCVAILYATTVQCSGTDTPKTKKIKLYPKIYI